MCEDLLLVNDIKLFDLASRGMVEEILGCLGRKFVQEVFNKFDHLRSSPKYKSFLNISVLVLGLKCFNNRSRIPDMYVIASFNFYHDKWVAGCRFC